MSFPTLENVYLGAVCLGSSLVGLANLVAPFDIMATRIERSGGGSVQSLFESTFKAVEVAEAATKAPVSTAPASGTSPTTNSAYGAAVAGTLGSGSNPAMSGHSLAAERLAVARENVDTLAALVASTMFQVQYAVGGDALVAYLAFVGLLPSTSLAERRLIHKCLGIVKTCQYSVYLFNEAITTNGISIANIIGLGVVASAAYFWGIRSSTSASKKPVSSAPKVSPTNTKPESGKAPY